MDYYIDERAGSDENPGTMSAPWKTRRKAAAMLDKGDRALIIPEGPTNPPYQDDWELIFRGEGGITTHNTPAVL